MSELGTREHALAVTKGRHPGVRDALQWLAFAHLPEALQNYSRPFYQTAVEMILNIATDSPELTTSLNKMIGAKDWAVRAGIKHDTGHAGPVSRPQTVVDPPLFAKGSATVPAPLGNYGPGEGPIDNRIGPNFGRPIGDRPQD